MKDGDEKVERTNMKWSLLNTGVCVRANPDWTCNDYLLYFNSILHKRQICSVESCIKAKPQRPLGIAGFEVRDVCQFESRTGGGRGIKTPGRPTAQGMKLSFCFWGYFWPFDQVFRDTLLRLCNSTEAWNNNRELAGP